MSIKKIQKDSDDFWHRKFWHFLTACHYSNSPNLVISFDYSWFLAQNLSFENSITGIAIICTVSSWPLLRKHLSTIIKQVWAKTRSNFANVLFQPIRDNLERFMLKSEFVQWLFWYRMTTGKIQKLLHFIHLFICLKAYFNLMPYKKVYLAK